MAALLFLLCCCCTWAAIVFAHSRAVRIDCSAYFRPTNLSAPVESCNKRNIAVLGAGYSGTGFISHVLTNNNCDIGHETMHQCGTSAEFAHIFAAVRNPMDYWNSRNATQFNFISARSRAFGVDFTGENHTFLHAEVVERQHPEFYWGNLSNDYRSLAIWVTYTEGALRKASHWYQLEDLSNGVCEGTIVSKILQVAHLPVPDPVVVSTQRVNIHNPNHASRAELWSSLRKRAYSSPRRMVLHHTERLAGALGYTL